MKEVHKAYRESLAGNLSSNTSKEEKKKILAEARSGLDYQNAKKKHQQEIRKSKHQLPEMIASRSQDNKFVGYLVDDYIEAVVKPDSQPDLRKERLKSLDIFKERLPGSVLVDLGCGSTLSSIDAYAFSTVFDVRKYVGIDKHAGAADPDYYAYEFGEMIKEWSIFKRIKAMDANKNFPSYSFTFEDMVKALSKRTERSNFMMNGVDSNILYSENEERDRAYLEKLTYHIARLTPPKGIVFGYNSRFLGGLAQHGFKPRYDLEQDNFLDQFWEKTA